MTVRIEPPLAYMRRDGTRGEIEDPGGWHHPTFDWSWYGDPESGWVHMGWAPKPTTRLGRAKRHLLHGLIMGYPLLDVLAWVWRVDIRDAVSWMFTRNGWFVAVGAWSIGGWWDRHRLFTERYGTGRSWHLGPLTVRRRGHLTAQGHTDG